VFRGSIFFLWFITGEPMPTKIIYRDEVFAIQGAVFEVYREMGCGFLEAVYQECLQKELTLRGIPFESQKDLQLSYKGVRLDQPISRIFFVTARSLWSSKR